MKPTNNSDINSLIEGLSKMSSLDNQRNWLYSLNDEEFRYIRNLIYEHCRINLHDGKKELVRARLSRRLRELQLSSFAEYCTFVRNNMDKELVVLVNLLSTNKTSFFREKSHFPFLNEILPDIAKKKRVGSRLRLWSSACSSGEEAYSIGMVVAGFLEKYPFPDTKILATDISTKVLEKAVTGQYEKDQVDSIPANYRKFLTKNKLEYGITEKVRHLITFRRLNIMGQWPFKGPFDVIFCCNMMIYFDHPTQVDLINRFYDYLAPQGYLFLGHSESLLGISPQFRNVKFKSVCASVYQKI